MMKVNLPKEEQLLSFVLKFKNVEFHEIKDCFCFGLYPTACS